MEKKIVHLALTTEELVMLVQGILTPQVQTAINLIEKIRQQTNAQAPQEESQQE